jgi:hypothetical protein
MLRGAASAGPAGRHATGVLAVFIAATVSGGARRRRRRASHEHLSVPTVPVCAACLETKTFSEDEWIR